MANVQGTFYRGETQRKGATPVSPPNAEDDPVDPVSPETTTIYKALGDVTDRDFIGKNGFVPVVNSENLLTLEPLPQIAENGLISGGIVQWTGTGYVFNVSSAFYRIGGDPYSSDPTQKTLSAPDATNDRIDVFAVDVNGVVVVIEGTPAATPVKPQIDPQTQLELTSVIVTAATTEPILTEEVIYDENVEWNGSTTGTGTVVFNSAVDPYQGSLSIEATNIQNGLKIRLTDGSDYDLSTVQTLGMQINLKSTMFAGQNIGVTFLDSSANPISSELVLNHDKSLIGYQFVGIALSQFSFISFNARSIEFRFIRTKGAQIYSGFFLDVIKLEGGINLPQTVGSFTGLNDTPSSYTGQGDKFVAVKTDESGLHFVLASSGISDAPNDGLAYTRKSLAWVQSSPYDLKQEGATDGQVLTWVAANSRYEPVTPSGGGSSLWTDATTHIYRNGLVTIGSTALYDAQMHVEGSFPSSSLGTLSVYNSNTGGVAISVNNGVSTRYFQVNGTGSVKAKDYTIIGTAYSWTVNGHITVNRFTANRMTLNAGFLQFANSTNIITGTTTGTKIGTATNQKLSFWNKTPIIQPTTGITASAFVANSSGIVDDTATFGGYTIGQIAAALINTGLLA